MLQYEVRKSEVQVQVQPLVIPTSWGACTRRVHKRLTRMAERAVAKVQKAHSEPLAKEAFKKASRAVRGYCREYARLCETKTYGEACHAVRDEVASFGCRLMKSVYFLYRGGLRVDAQLAFRQVWEEETW